ncbi:MAG TPA: NAD(P)/FAD-dependent oxidoreductase [Candidatus Paceibacterota bacterium]|nr:NAD(P)/FAD-dependent oxidoreductase [Candidatus Paceibacterota bacterium]
MITVVILGGGFGGIRCALDLAGKGREAVRVILVERNSYHLFTPSLYEVASAYPVPGDTVFHVPLRRAVAVPYREIFAGKNIEVVQSEIAAADLAAHEVTLKGGDKIPFDYCVLGLGSETADFGISGVREYAYPFKTIEDALAINQKMHELFRTFRDSERPAPIKFLVIGAGFAGVELAAEIASYARRIADDLDLPRKSFSVALFEAAPTILPMIDARYRASIIARLTELGVAVMAGSTIESVTADSVSLKSGQTVSGAMVIWTAGVRASSTLGAIKGLHLTERSKIAVDRTLAVPNFPHTFAVGDVIEYIDPKTEKPVPGLAYTAKAQASVVASNILADLRERKKKYYIPHYDAWIAPIGGKFSFAHINNSTTFPGLIGWLVRGLVDLRYLLSILPPLKAFRLFWSDQMMFTKND